MRTAWLLSLMRSFFFCVSHGALLTHVQGEGKGLLRIGRWICRKFERRAKKVRRRPGCDVRLLFLRA
jgi:hypothetical protein